MNDVEAELANLRADNQRLQRENEQLKAQRSGLLTANAQLVAHAAGNDPAAVVRATFGGSPTLTLRAFARFQGLDLEQDVRLLNEVLQRISGYQFIDPDEMAEFCRELRCVLKMAKPKLALICSRCGEPGLLSSALVNDRYLAFRFHHRGSAATHAGSNDGRLPRLASVVSSSP